MNTWTLQEIHEILGSKREDRFSNPFFEVVQKTCQVLSYLLRLGNFCKGPRTLRKFPQKCQKIAKCWGRAVYVRNLWSPRHLAHPLWNDPVQTISRVNHGLTQRAPVTPLLVLCLAFSTKRAWQSWSKHFKRWHRGMLRETMVDSWYCIDPVVLERMSQVSKRLVAVHKRRALNTRLSSGTSAGTFACPAGLYRTCRGEAGTKNEPQWYFVPIQKKGWKIHPHVSNLKSRWFFFRTVHVPLRINLWPLRWGWVFL